MASWVGGEIASPAQLDKVARAIRKTPIIDNHAHPLLKTEALRTRSLLSIMPDPSGDAINATPTTLSHLRAVKQLSAMLDCDATWEAVVSAIEEKHSGPYGEWVRSCLMGIETILIDDGLDSGDDAFAYSWHDSYTRGKCKRIVRIEKVAMDIMVQAFTGKRLVPAKNQTPETITTFLMGEFCLQIKASLEDPEVVGFKSVICYRTGLAVPKRTTLKEASQGFDEAWTDFGRGKFERLQYFHLNNYLVQETARLISSSQHKKPLQFHTGLGDNDIILTKSSPAHLQEFIQAHPLVPIVLLHASYPFTREAGYLASVYANVYADIGGVFPCVSQGGQETVLRQILELAPFSKILWSTDGHWFPEKYALAVRQMREVFQTVLLEYVRQGHIGWEAAVALVRDVLFENSNKLYQLGLQLVELADDEEDSDHRTPQTYLDRFDALLPGGMSCDFVRICWTDFTATTRMRMVPFRKFTSLLREGRSVDIGIAKASLGMLQNDMMVSGGSATGEYRLYPDFESLKRGPVDGHVSMYGDFREASGAKVAICPRSLLRSTVEFGIENKLTFALGFEIEFLLVERQGRDSVPSRFVSLQTDGHAWSVSQYYADPKISQLLSNMVTELSKAGTYVEQVHAESTPGQFEVILPPLPPVEAVDTLLHAREIMSALATAAGYRMTLHPKPSVDACGTAAHTHISISSADGSKPEVYEPFYAGILGHLPAILAFTYSNPVSYERMGDGVWSGGRWVAWGTQNRETPLRKIEDSHWELKCVDGLANMYLAMSAVLQAGMHGVLSQDKLVWGDCQTDPAGLTSDQREKLVVTQQLPATLPAALSALQKDARLPKLMGTELVDRYIAVKDAEMHLLGNMGNEERRQWIMERY